MKRTLFLTLLCLINMTAVSQNNVPWQNAKGNGTLASPWLLENANQLDALANQVNDGTHYAGQYFALTADIEANAGTIIGDSLTHPFRGFADGRGHSVTTKAGTVSGEADGYRLEGLFGYLSDGAVVTNFNVKGTVTAQGAAGCRLFSGAIAAIVGEGAKVLNCTASATVTASGTADGQKASSSYAGNLVGYNLGSIINCIASGAKAPSVSYITTPYVGTAIGYNGFSGQLFTNPFAVNGKASLPAGSIGKITVTLKDKTGKTLASQTGDSPLTYKLDTITFLKSDTYSLEISAPGYTTITTTPSLIRNTPEEKLSFYISEDYITTTGGSSMNGIGRVFGNGYPKDPTDIYANKALTINGKTTSTEVENGTDITALSSSPWWKPDGTRSMAEMLNAAKPVDGNIILETTSVHYTTKFREWKDGVSAAKPAVLTTNTTI